MREEKDKDFWLNKDPDPIRQRMIETQLQREKLLSSRNRLSSQKTAKNEQGSKLKPERDIHIKISLPSLASFKKLLFNISKKAMPVYIKLLTVFSGLRLGKRFAAVAIVAAVVGLGAVLLIGKPDSKITNGVGGTTKYIPPEKQVGFKPLVPENKLGAAKGQTLGYHYDKTRKVVGYNDEYAGAKLTISEQQLPDNIKKDPTVLKKAAEGIGAKRPLESAKGTIYIATDAKTSKQTMVVRTDSLLVFVQSDQTLDDYFWVKYINSLKET